MKLYAAIIAAYSFMFYICSNTALYAYNVKNKKGVKLHGDT